MPAYTPWPSGLLDEVLLKPREPAIDRVDRARSGQFRGRERRRASTNF